MRVLVFGCGNIGSVAAKDVAINLASADVVVADIDENRARRVAENIGTDNVSHIQLDATDYQSLLTTVKDFAIVLGFLPGGLGYRLATACVKARKNMVDVSYMAENPLKLSEEAEEADITIVPDCGLAPGISNLFVGHAVASLDRVKTVHILVGGLPEKPVPPLGYTITWSPESLIDEYTRKAGIIDKGVKSEVEALTGLEKIVFPSLGRLEAFYTDGLRTLLHTIEGVEEMWEKTVRYPGHAEKIKTLKALGFFDQAQVEVGNVSVSPRLVTARLFERKLHKQETKDVVALRVEVSGTKNGRQLTYTYNLLDFYDQTQKITAMARTTAYPASIIAQLLFKKTLKFKGVVPLEMIGKNDTLFKALISELQRRHIKVIEEKTAG
jgi:saccharopine dehydrogenase-like NADP-dependent oxidoreductase